MNRSRVNTRWTAGLLMTGLLAVLTPCWVTPVHGADFEVGLLMYRSGDYPMAIRYFRQALKNPQRNPNIHYYLADALVKTSRLDEARWEYQKIIAMAPESQAARLSKVGLIQLEQFMENTGPRYGLLSGGEQSADGPDLLSGLNVSGSHYLDDVSEGGTLLRWSTRTNPLKLYIEQSPPGIRNFQPTFTNQVRRAMDAWMNALDNRMGYVMVDTPEQANIRVYWVNTIDNKGFKTDKGTTYTAGLTLPVVRSERLMTMDVRMSTFDLRQKPQSGEDIYRLALHELGHALGLRGHSDNPVDIMYPESQKSIQALSSRDINTIRLLYGQEVDITNLPPKKEQSDPERLQDLLARMDQEVVKMEAMVQDRGSHLNLNNLGSTYFQKGKLLKRLQRESETAQETPEKQPVFWYDKALDAFSRALKQESQSADTYFNRAVVYQALGDYANALSDVDAAIRYNPREYKYLLEKAFTLKAMGRKAEAENALNAYLLRVPEARSSSQVQKLRRELSSAAPSGGVQIK